MKLKNKKSQSLGFNKIIGVILVVLVIAVVLMFIFKANVLAYIKNLPGYEKQESSEVDITSLDKDTLAKLGYGCDEDDEIIGALDSVQKGGFIRQQYDEWRGKSYRLLFLYDEKTETSQKTKILVDTADPNNYYFRRDKLGVSPIGYAQLSGSSGRLIIKLDQSNKTYFNQAGVNDVQFNRLNGGYINKNRVICATQKKVLELQKKEMCLSESYLRDNDPGLNICDTIFGGVCKKDDSSLNVGSEKTYFLEFCEEDEVCVVPRSLSITQSGDMKLNKFDVGSNERHIVSKKGNDYNMYVKNSLIKDGEIVSPPNYELAFLFDVDYSKSFCYSFLSNIGLGDAGYIDSNHVGLFSSDSKGIFSIGMTEESGKFVYEFADEAVQLLIYDPLDGKFVIKRIPVSNKLLENYHDVKFEARELKTGEIISYDVNFEISHEDSIYILKANKITLKKISSEKYRFYATGYIPGTFEGEKEYLLDCHQWARGEDLSLEKFTSSDITKLIKDKCKVNR